MKVRESYISYDNREGAADISCFGKLQLQHKLDSGHSPGRIFLRREEWKNAAK